MAGRGADFLARGRANFFAGRRANAFAGSRTARIAGAAALFGEAGLEPATEFLYANFFVAAGIARTTRRRADFLARRGANFLAGRRAASTVARRHDNLTMAVAANFDFLAGIARIARRRANLFARGRKNIAARRRTNFLARRRANFFTGLAGTGTCKGGGGGNGNEGHHENYGNRNLLRHLFLLAEWVSKDGCGLGTPPKLRRQPQL